MRRAGWLGLLAAALIAGCLRPPAATPTPSPVPTAVPAQTPQPTVSPSAVPTVAITTSQGISYTSPLHGYALTLPAAWLVATPKTAEDAATPSPEVIARLDAAAGSATLTVTALPRDGLTLASYLAQTAATIAADGGQVVRAELDPTLRRDGLPAAVIEYTAGDRAGYQAALVAQDPDTLIVLTFVAEATVYAELRDGFIQIVRGAAPAAPFVNP